MQGGPSGAARASRCSLAAARQCGARQAARRRCGLPHGARTARSAAQHGPRFAGPVPCSRRGSPLRPAEWLCPRERPARSACLCACAGARSARSDQMPAGPPQGASSQATRGATGQGRKGGEPAVFHSSFVPSAASPVRPRRRRAHPGTVAAPRTSPSRSCRASQLGDTPSSLPKRHRAAGRGAEQQRGPAPSNLRRGGPDPHRQRRRGAVRPVRKPPAGCLCTFRPALALAAPRASGGLHERRICQAWMCTNVTALPCRGAVCKRIFDASHNGLHAGPPRGRLRRRPPSGGSTQRRARAGLICAGLNAPRLQASTLRTWPPAAHL